jgi:adenosylhomocysteine nucleosidase
MTVEGGLVSTQVLIVIALADELHGVIDAMPFPVLQCGVGKINAATALATHLSRQPVDLVLNYGSAGGISERACGLIEIAEVVQRDMNAEPLAPRGRTPFDPCFGRLSSGYAGVRCATGDSFVTSHDEWLHQQGVDVVDMELFALAKVCERFNTPWRSFKFVSDRADHNSADEWQKNVHGGSEEFFDKVSTIFR